MLNIYELNYIYEDQRVTFGPLYKKPITQYLRTEEPINIQTKTV